MEFSTHWGVRNAYRILDDKPVGNRPFGTRWKDNIKMNLKETMCENVDCIQTAQNKIQWWVLVMNLQVP